MSDGGLPSRRCYGFGEREDDCPNEPGGKWSPYFCPECDEARVAHISAQMDKISVGFAARLEAKRG